MVARDQLAEEAQREELDADDDEQDAERQQRPVPDRLAADLDRRQVGENDHPDRNRAGAEPAEEVQRPVAVAAHERDGEQVEEPADVALDAVARAAVLARPVVHRQLGDPEAAVVGEHGHEAVQLAVEAQSSDDLGAVRLEPAVQVVQAQTRRSAR